MEFTKYISKNILLLLIITSGLFIPIKTFAQDDAIKYIKGEVTKVISEKEDSINNDKTIIQKLEVKLENSRYIQITYGDQIPITQNSKLYEGNEVILAHQTIDNEDIYNIEDIYRIPSLYIIIGAFIVISMLFAKMRGVLAMIGLAFSFVVIFTFMIPNILNGSNPLLTSIFGGILISLFSYYLTHGINSKSTIAFISTLITLVLVGLTSYAFVLITRLNGTGSEEALFIQMGTFANLNLQGLLLGGIIIGALGVLDDITISQTSIVRELKSVNKKLSFIELYKRSTSIGKDHIASLINTLALAYTGASFPLLLLFYSNNEIPYWVSINSEFIFEEILRAIIGSLGLILAVPITSLFAAYYYSKYLPKKSKHSLSHVH